MFGLSTSAALPLPLGLIFSWCCTHSSVPHCEETLCRFTAHLQSIPCCRPQRPGRLCWEKLPCTHFQQGQLTAPESRAPRRLRCHQVRLHISIFRGSNINVWLRFNLFLSISRHFYSLLPRESLLRLFQGYSKYLLLYTYETGGLSTQNRTQIVAGVGCMALLCFCSVRQCWPCSYPILFWLFLVL